METIPLLYHPVTALVVDSSAAFLRSLALHLPGNDRVYCLCSHPMLALEKLKQSDEEATFINQMWVNPTRQLDQQQSAVTAKHENIQGQLRDKSRFGNVFAVVLEHEMSPLNGLQLCKRIVNPFVQKVLLTASVHEQMIDRAKQQGLVDAVIYKHDPNMLQKLSQVLQHAQERYFHLISAAYSEALQIEEEAKAFLGDRAFRDFFAQLRQGLGTIEHHVYGYPDGFVLVDASGTCHGLCVQTKEQFDTLAASSILQQASEQVQHDIRKRRKMLCVPRACCMPQAQQWDGHVQPAQVVSGLDTYYCACVRGMFHVSEVTGFATYENKIDLRLAS
ncbi:MAG: hypothetical protein AAF320_02125 [Myxococcota bacterium]